MSASERKVLRSIHISRIWDREIRRLAFLGQTSWQEIAVGSIERFLEFHRDEQIPPIREEDRMLGYSLTLKTLYVPWDVDERIQEYAKGYPDSSLSAVIRGILKKMLDLPERDGIVSNPDP